MSTRRAILIMAGGRGTRLWPLSRKNRPKQLLSLVTDKTLLEDAYARLVPLADPSVIFVVAEEDILLDARPLLPDMPLDNFLAEPAARNTWPCCVLGTLEAAARLGEDTTVLVVPADHAVADEKAFRAALAAGFARAAGGAVVTFGIRPTRADTGYGYIQCGEELGAEEPHVHAGLSFAEKPDAATARAYLSGGNYLWNSGMFVWRADRFLELARERCPGEYGAVERLREALAAGGDDIAKAYARLTATSVDYAFMEKLGTFEVVEADCGWDDIGSFDALARVLAADARGNVTRGEVYALDGVGNVILAGGRRPVILLGADNVVVVDAGDAVLIYPKGAGQEVRRAVELMREKRPDLL